MSALAVHKVKIESNKSKSKGLKKWISRPQLIDTQSHKLNRHYQIIRGLTRDTFLKCRTNLSSYEMATQVRNAKQKIRTELTTLDARPILCPSYRGGHKARELKNAEIESAFHESNQAPSNEMSSTKCPSSKGNQIITILCWFPEAQSLNKLWILVYT